MVFSTFSPGQEFTTTGQKSFEQTGFQSVLSGMYSPIAFSASGASLTEVHLFCLLACDRDSCCDGFILTQVQGGNMTVRAGASLLHDLQSTKFGEGMGLQKTGYTTRRMPGEAATLT